MRTLSRSDIDETLQAIIDYQAEHGYPPAVRDLCAILGLSSSASVHQRLAYLMDEGYITKVPDCPRTLRVVVPPPTVGVA